MPDDAEILRIRNRLHDIDALLAALRWKSTGQEREIATIRRELYKVRSIVEEMSQADEIARAVTDAQRQERQRWLTRPRKAVAALLALLVAAPALHDLVNWLHWF